MILHCSARLRLTIRMLKIQSSGVVILELFWRLTTSCNHQTPLDLLVRTKMHNLSILSSIIVKKYDSIFSSVYDFWLLDMRRPTLLKISFLIFLKGKRNFTIAEPGIRVQRNRNQNIHQPQYSKKTLYQYLSKTACKQPGPGTEDRLYKGVDIKRPNIILGE